MRCASFVAAFAIAAIAGVASAADLPRTAFTMFEGIELPAQVFVADPHAVAATTDTRVIHVAGVRRADASDPPTAELLNADGGRVQVTLGKWRAAHGSFTMTPNADGTARLDFAFGGLVVFGRYSLFAQGPGDTDPILPLDVLGKTNDFDADASGDAKPRVVAPGPLVPGSRVLLVLHSDGETHGTSPGDLTRFAHVQMQAQIGS